MKKIKILLILISTYSLLFSQINKDILYPLEIGNYWEYTNYINVHYYEKVVEEVEMSNGKSYKKIIRVDLIEEDSTYYFKRTEDNLRIYSYVNGSEFKEFDFGLPVGSLWESYGVYKKIANRRNSFLSIIQDTVLVDDMIYVFIDSLISPPDTSVIIDLYDSFAKGVGFISAGWPEDYLTGLIINGKEYGMVSVGITEPTVNNNHDLTFQVYPNPFNVSTRISLNNNIFQKIEIDVHNILGQKIKEVENRVFIEGKYTFNLNLKNISSGLYFLVLKTSNNIQTKKLILLK